ncbi:hypothetical protein D8682_00335 (plasmid) [Buttiauxella sp. 3AFRM03]|uniref:hypothetical protein n=1 Tax=Buttiauxella sp. 3AFRM03 TaxID=2479367 RepID=UPI000EF7EE08|nr:hypothetical protein [Buttiauxella sp. 3AFRM03]AYN25561.1 hypothetical protein D8682_00335 [Buttiauxella sp. 3AFRM03]
MNNEERKDVPAGHAEHDQDAELTRLLTGLGINSDGLYLSKERIEEISATDADEEKRQLAWRLLQMQQYAQGLSYLRFLTTKHAPGANIFNPLDPLDERHLIKGSDIAPKS